MVNDRLASIAASPLSNGWALWVMSQQGKMVKDHWQASQTKTADIATVGDFWRLYNNIHPASKLGHVDYSLFKKGIAPAWEDPSCKEGGRWVAKVPNNIDEVWQNVQLALLSDTFKGSSEYVCGAVMSARRGGSKISVWVSTCDEEKALAVGSIFKGVLASSLPNEEVSVVFESFAHTGETALKI